MTAYYAFMGWIITNALIFIGAIELHHWSRRRSNARREAERRSIWARLLEPAPVPLSDDRSRASGFERTAEARAKTVVAPVPRR